MPPKKASNNSNAAAFKHRKAKVGKKKLAAANVTNTSFKYAVLADVARGAAQAEKRDAQGAGKETSAVESEERYNELLKHLSAHSADSRKEAVVAISKTAVAAPHLVLRNFGRTLLSLAARIPDPEAPVRSVLPLAFENVLAVTADAAQLEPFSPTVFAYLASALTSLQTNTRLDALATLAVWAKVPNAIPSTAQERVLTALISLLEGQHHSLVASSVLLAAVPPILDLGSTTGTASGGSKAGKLSGVNARMAVSYVLRRLLLATGEDEGSERLFVRAQRRTDSSTASAVATSDLRPATSAPLFPLFAAPLGAASSLNAKSFLDAPLHELFSSAKGTAAVTKGVSLPSASASTGDGHDASRPHVLLPASLAKRAVQNLSELWLESSPEEAHGSPVAARYRLALLAHTVSACIEACGEWKQGSEAGTKGVWADLQRFGGASGAAAKEDGASTSAGASASSLPPSSSLFAEVTGSCLNQMVMKVFPVQSSSLSSNLGASSSAAKASGKGAKQDKAEAEDTGSGSALMPCLQQHDSMRLLNLRLAQVAASLLPSSSPFAVITTAAAASRPPPPPAPVVTVTVAPSTDRNSAAKAPEGEAKTKGKEGASNKFSLLLDDDDGNDDSSGNDEKEKAEGAQEGSKQGGEEVGSKRPRPWGQAAAAASMDDGGAAGKRPRRAPQAGNGLGASAFGGGARAATVNRSLYTSIDEMAGEDDAAADSSGALQYHGHGAASQQQYGDRFDRAGIIPAATASSYSSSSGASVESTVAAAPAHLSQRAKQSIAKRAHERLTALAEKLSCYLLSELRACAEDASMNAGAGRAAPVATSNTGNQNSTTGKGLVAQSSKMKLESASEDEDEGQSDDDSGSESGEDSSDEEEEEESEEEEEGEDSLDVKKSFSARLAPHLVSLAQRALPFLAAAKPKAVLSLVDAIWLLYSAAAPSDPAKVEAAFFLQQLLQQGEARGLATASSPTARLQRAFATALDSDQRKDVSSRFLASLPRLMWSVGATDPGLTRDLVSLLHSKLRTARSESPVAALAEAPYRECARQLVPLVFTVKKAATPGADGVPLFGPFGQLPKDVQTLLLDTVRLSALAAPSVAGSASQAEKASALPISLPWRRALCIAARNAELSSEVRSAAVDTGLACAEVVARMTAETMVDQAEQEAKARLAQKMEDEDAEAALSFVPAVESSGAATAAASPAATKGVAATSNTGPAAAIDKPALFARFLAEHSRRERQAFLLSVLLGRTVETTAPSAAAGASVFKVSPFSASEAGLAADDEDATSGSSLLLPAGLPAELLALCQPHWVSTLLLSGDNNANDERASLNGVLGAVTAVAQECGSKTITEALVPATASDDITKTKTPVDYARLLLSLAGAFLQAAASTTGSAGLAAALHAEEAVFVISKSFSLPLAAAVVTSAGAEASSFIRSAGLAAMTVDRTAHPAFSFAGSSSLDSVLAFSPVLAAALLEEVASLVGDDSSDGACLQLPLLADLALRVVGVRGSAAFVHAWASYHQQAALAVGAVASPSLQHSEKVWQEAAGNLKALIDKAVGQGMPASAAPPHPSQVKKLQLVLPLKSMLDALR